MIYCMADLHGDLVRFHRMLKQISFTPADQLYILGDVIDRGPHGVALLEEIMAAPNMTLLLGNHEWMCLGTFLKKTIRGAGEHWRLRCGGEVTYQALMSRPPQVRAAILRFLSALPDHLELSVSGIQYHLVHGMPAENTYDRVWGRPTLRTPRPFPDKTVLVGHTPTSELGLPFLIWHGNGLLDLDCGCGEDPERGHLGCLRLEDGQEFYT